MPVRLDKKKFKRKAPQVAEAAESGAKSGLSAVQKALLAQAGQDEPDEDEPPPPPPGVPPLENRPKAVPTQPFAQFQPRQAIAHAQPAMQVHNINLCQLIICYISYLHHYYIIITSLLHHIYIIT